ncbi:MAG: WHG domain-containing protein, partial [Chloroflexales bacterium]|nr:WHG domain-containing protein [Chloroflexales bacterium]
AQQAGYGMPPQLIHEALAGWAHMQGLITLELFNHLQPTVGDTAAFYATEMRRYLERLGMRPTNEV